MPRTLVGVDLSASPRAPSATAVLDASGALVRLTAFAADEELLELVRPLPRPLLALDAPLGLPLGLCCLEPSCPCHPLRRPGLRSAEVALARRVEEGCFPTTGRMVRPLARRGRGRAPRLAAAGCGVIEVYPYATRALLWGRRQPPKTTRQGLALLRWRLAALVPGVAPHAPHLTHHQADALLAAHTALLHARGESEALGVPEEGCIIVPRVAG